MNTVTRKLASGYSLCAIFLLLLETNAAHAAGTWTPTGSMATGHSSHAAALLPSGKALVCGGLTGDGSTSTNTTEVYNAGSGTWGLTSSMASSRFWHTATLLTSGSVLVVGGDVSNYNPLASAELYRESTGNWTSAGNMAQARDCHKATLLSSGKVLITGGCGSGSNYLNTAESYDPAAGTWSTTSGMTTARKWHAAVLLSNGKVLVAGGENGGNSAELYNPSTGTWATTGSMLVARRNQAAVVLNNGKVLVSGGYNGGALTSAELFDPASETWTATGSMSTARMDHTATLLSDGTVLVVGTQFSGGATAEIYNPAAGTWSQTASMNNARFLHTAAILTNNQIMVAGGMNGVPLASAEIYTLVLPPVITSATTASGTVGVAFSYSITATNNPTSFNATSLPPGLILTSTGAITGMPTVAGTWIVTISATNAGGAGSATLTITINPPAPAITSATTASGSVGAAFSYQITASNSPTSYGATSLPSWASVNTSTGAITGTPNATGSANVTISATNANGTGSATLTVTINAPTPVITGEKTAAALVGVPFSYSIMASNNPTSYSATGLPSWASVNASTGVVTGTPDTAGSVDLTLSASNAGGTGTATLALTVYQYKSDMDSDGDGFPDEIEIALGTNPNDPNSTPWGGSPAGPKQQLSALKLAIKLNFTRSGSDSITLSGTLTISGGFVVAGQSVTVDVGGVVKTFSLDSKGSSPRGGSDSFKLAVKAKKGVVAAQTAKFSAKFNRGDFGALLAGEGLTNADVKNAPRTIPVIILFNQKLLEVYQAQFYTAKAGKGGQTK